MPCASQVRTAVSSCEGRYAGISCTSDRNRDPGGATLRRAVESYRRRWHGGRVRKLGSGIFILIGREAVLRGGVAGGRRTRALAANPFSGQGRSRYGGSCPVERAQTGRRRLLGVVLGARRSVAADRTRSRRFRRERWTQG